jgi:hypothetical protein
VQVSINQETLSDTNCFSNFVDSMEINLSSTKTSDSSHKNINNKKVPECLQYLGLATSESVSNKRNNLDKNVSKVNEHFHFVKPKLYDCDYCNARYLHISIYLKHIRQHKDILRCIRCNKTFKCNIYKRRHEIRCQNRTKF